VNGVGGLLAAGLSRRRLRLSGDIERNAPVVQPVGLEHQCLDDGFGSIRSGSCSHVASARIGRRRAAGFVMRLIIPATVGVGSVVFILQPEERSDVVTGPLRVGTVHAKRIRAAAGGLWARRGLLANALSTMSQEVGLRPHRRWRIGYAVANSSDARAAIGSILRRAERCRCRRLSFKSSR